MSQTPEPTYSPTPVENSATVSNSVSPNDSQLASLTDEDFFKWVGVCTAGLLIILALAVLLLPLPHPNIDWMKGSLMAILGLLPVFVILFGTGVSYEKSKTVNFCDSCHVMDSRVQDLKDPQAESLAALHYKNRYIRENQCFTCHTDYTLFGDEKAKMTGIRHVYALLFTQVKEPLKLYKPYDTGNCLHCHGESKKFLESPTHLDILQDLKTKQTSCMDCHGPAHTMDTTEGTP